MKKTLFAFMLLASLQSNGQFNGLIYDTTSVAGIYWGKPQKQVNDTIPAMLQYSDTSYHVFCQVLFTRGYIVKRYEPYGFSSSQYGYNNGLWIVTSYLTQAKQPIPINWIVWMALETKKDW